MTTTIKAVDNPIFVRLDAEDVLCLLRYLERRSELLLPPEQEARLQNCLESGLAAWNDDERDLYLEVADGLFGRDGEIEFDSDGSISHSEYMGPLDEEDLADLPQTDEPRDQQMQGAYVQGWIYVDRMDFIKARDGEPDDG